MSDKNRWMCMIALLLLCTASVVSLHYDENERQLKEIKYCKMTMLWEQTGGKYGWAPYNDEIKCSN